MELFVKYSSHCSSSYHSSEQYGRWNEAYSFDVTGVQLTDPKSYSVDTINVNFEAVPGDTVWVMSITYSTGDSFGYATGKGEVIWVFKDQDTAEQASQIWTKTANDAVKVSFPVDSGETIKLCSPVYGYFERLEHVSIQAFVLEQ